MEQDYIIFTVPELLSIARGERTLTEVLIQKCAELQAYCEHQQNNKTDAQKRGEA